MQTVDARTRDTWGCGFLPVPEGRVRLRVWRHPGSDVTPTLCAGYTTKLPEVIEVAQARLHWSKGALNAFTRGEPASEALLDGIQILESEQHRVEAWEADEARRKSGGR